MRFHRVDVFLVFLLCLNWTWAQEKNGGYDESKFTEETDEQSEINENRQKNTSPDIWTELKELRDMVIKQEVDLSYSKTKIENLERETTVLEARLSSSETEVEELKRENAERPKVAFSFGLTDAGTTGPLNTDITLKFTKVFTNFGQAYNPNTGIFTAPIRGVYYFRFSAINNNVNAALGVQVYLNGKRVSWNYDRDSTSSGRITNAFVFQLEKGDVVYLVLPGGHEIYDDVHNRNTFSGFLLFPV
ncbi:complement C1q-like protein 2 [Sphaeramia orbicularis]|uniref:complement C1q-like protein 2 n=1 Tax=Sphaeramia orbicularis TaxID=375764 RepID=UPI00117DF862|nr:complement C1q-like protein 2 [Sphaeramia orbicularis]